MGRIEAIAKLRQHAQAIRAMGATSLYVFGSTVRDDGQTARDLDLFIDYDPNGSSTPSTSSASNNISRTSLTFPST